MNKRDFIATTGVVGLSPLVPKIESNFMISSDYMMGYQLYSIRDRMAKSPIETIKALKGFGYGDFEIYGFDPRLITIY